MKAERTVLCVCIQKGEAIPHYIVINEKLRGQGRAMATHSMAPNVRRHSSWSLVDVQLTYAEAQSRQLLAQILLASEQYSPHLLYLRNSEGDNGRQAA